jgi:adenylate cyclase
MRRRLVVLCALAASLAVAALWIVRPTLVADLDLRVYDELLRQSQPPKASGRVAIVAVDEKSLAEVGQWPWPRDVVAHLVDRVRELGAEVIAFDIILSEFDRLGAARPAPPRGRARQTTTTDAILATSFTRSRVVMSYALTFDRPTGGPSGCILHPLPVVLVQRPGQTPPADRLFRANDVVCSLPTLAEAAGASGYLNAGADTDGILRRVPLVMAYRGDVYPSLALAAVQALTGVQSLQLVSEGDHPLTLHLDDRAIPLDARGGLLLGFRGPGGTFRHVSASDVLSGRLPAGSFKNQIVFLGATALGVDDLVATPLDTSFPGIEVHATVADSVLTGTFVTYAPYGAAWELGAAIAAGLVMAGLVMLWGLVWGGLAASVGVAGVWLVSSRLLETRDLFFSPLLATLAAAGTLATLTVARARVERQRADAEQRRRQQAHRFIAQSLTTLTETRDVNTGRHARRTQTYTRLVAGQLAKSPRFRNELNADTVELLAILAPLHDIGKVGIPDALLNKPGALTPSEYAEMQKHPRLGYDAIVKAESQALIEDEQIIHLAKDIVYTHHERWDGSGYPRGLKGEGIPIAGRIIAVVDVYDAMVASRTYRQSLAHEQAVSLIEAQRGTHFDPDVVDAFVAVERQIHDQSMALRDDVATPTGAASPASSPVAPGGAM